MTAQPPVPNSDAPNAPTRSLTRGFSSLAHRNFRLFWLGQLVSLIGTWMQQIAQAWLLLELTNNPFALGLASAFQFGPVLVFGLFAGVLADAVPKRRALIATQSAAMALAFVLGFLVLTGRVQVWHVYVLAMALGFVNAVDMPVRQAFVVEMVGREHVGNAVALNSVVFNGSRIVGPAIAGLVIGTVGVAACFMLNGASYIAVIIGLVVMREHELHARARIELERSWASVIGRLREGLVYVRTTPVVFMAISVLAVVSTFGMNFSVLVPLLARDVLHGNATTYGFLMAASGIGSLISAGSIAYGLRPTLKLLLTGAAVFGLALIGLGISHLFPLSVALMVVLGWGVIAIAAPTNTLIQMLVPDHLRGRVMSVYTTVFAGSTPIGGVFSGSIASAFGVSAALMVGGAMSVLVALAAATRLPPTRQTMVPTTRPQTPTSGG